jgi:hypothetical protein
MQDWRVGGIRVGGMWWKLVAFRAQEAWAGEGGHGDENSCIKWDMLYSNAIGWIQWRIKREWIEGEIL